MEETDTDQTRTMTKNFLRSMPIWEYFDKTRVEFQKLEYDMKTYLKRLDLRCERVAKLPLLNITNQLKVLPHDHGKKDLDIIRVYKKTNGQYRLKEKDKIPEQKSDYCPIDAESMAMLKKKLQVDEEIYAMINPKKPWVKCKILCVFCRPRRECTNKPIIAIRVKTPPEHKSRVMDVDKYSIARIQQHLDRLLLSKRVIAGLTKSTMMPGIIGHEPSENNNYRYLVLMDDGSAHYFKLDQVYPIFGQTTDPWLDSRYLRDENKQNDRYLLHFFGSYPKRHIMQASIGDKIEVIRNGILAPATIINMDCDIMRVLFKDNYEESIYRGSPRLMKKTDVINRQLASMKNKEYFHPKLLYALHFYYTASRIALDEDIYQCIEGMEQKIVITKRENTARKSTGASRKKSPPRVRVRLDGELIDENRMQIDDWDNERYGESRAHRCSVDCLVSDKRKTETSVVDIVDEFREVSDLKVPMLLGWKRSLRRIPTNTRSGKFKISVVYEAPCGKIFQKPFDIRRYLNQTNSKMDIDYFSFDRDLELNRQFGEFTPLHYVPNIAVDSETKKPLENKFISVFNQYNEEELPQDFEYRNETFPHPMLKSKGFSFNTEFKSSCDCVDDCMQRSTCACHRLNEEFFGRHAHNRGSVESKCQYNHKRLQAQVSTGIFECNSMCSCSSKCSNRVVQNGIRFRLQVQKTLSKGWGVITLDDIPSGAFICTYSAELLDDADQYGDSDMYYADLDYITVNQQQKEGFSDSEKSDEGVEDLSSEESGSPIPKQRAKRKNRPRISESDESEEIAAKNGDDGSSISSLDGEVVLDKYMPNNGKPETVSRYPKRKQQPPANPRVGRKEGRPQFKSIHEILESHDYTLDARMQGNIGRFFNHSCDPNSTVQNVFIETHDLRFPVVAFFSSKTIKALEEITWNYNYKMGCIEGRRIDCHCGAPNCRGRIL